MKPPAPKKPLSSEDLARDADAAGVASDELTESGSDPHLPASESGSIPGEDRRRPPVDRGLTELPPG